MWYCLDCKKRFDVALVEINNISICPFCGSKLVADYSDFHFSKAEMEKMNPDLSEADLFAIDEIEAGMESCTGCESIAECTNGVWLDEEAELPEWEAEISFNDMDVNEKLLLNLPIEDVVPITYITEMNHRFLHTFMDSCFVPA